MIQLFILLLFLAQTAFAQPIVKSAGTISDLLNRNPSDISTNVFLSDFTAQFDGLGGLFTYRSGSVLSTNTTDIFKPLSYSGRWVRSSFPVNSSTIPTIVANIPALVALTTNSATVFFVRGYTTPNDGGEGVFQKFADDGSTTNLGTIFRSTYNTNILYKRSYNSEPINVKWFGTGTGSSNDSATLSNVIATASQNSIVFIPGDTTLTVSDIRIDKTISLFGPGTLKQSANATRSMLIIGADSDPNSLTGAIGGTNYAQPTIANITLDGNNANNPLTNALQAAANLYIVNGYKTAFVKNCVFTNSSYVAIFNGGNLFCYDSEFRGMSKHDGTSGHETYTIFGQPASVTNPTFSLMTVSRCHFIASDTNISTITNNPAGIFLTLSSGITTNKYRKVIIDHCIFNGMGTFMQSVGNYAGSIDSYDGARELIIDGNQFYNCPYAALKLQHPDKFNIVNNIIDNVDTPLSGYGGVWGILIDPISRTSSATDQFNIVAANNISNVRGYGVLSSARNVLIQGNILQNITTNTGSGTLGRAIEINAPDNSVIGNKIYNYGTYGISVISDNYYSSGISNIVVSLNNIDSQNNTNQNNAIVFGSVVNTSMITDNIINGVASTTAPIYIASGSNNTIKNNKIITQQTASLGIRIELGETNLITENQFYGPFTTPISLGTVTNYTRRFNSCDPVPISFDPLSITVPSSYPYSIARTDNIVAVDSSSAHTVTLPTPVNFPGQVITLKDSTGNAAANTITIQTAAATIDGAASTAITNNYGSKQVYSNGANWFTF